MSAAAAHPQILAATRSRTAAVALAARAAAHQGQLAALAARVALVTLQPGQADLVIDARRHGHRLVVAVAVLRQRVQVARARRGEGSVRKILDRAFAEGIGRGLVTVNVGFQNSISARGRDFRTILSSDKDLELLEWSSS